MVVDNLIYIILPIYVGIWVVSAIVMLVEVESTRGDLEKPFTPWQTFFGPVIWPWYLVKAVIWWFQTSWSMLCSLYKCLRTNEWE